MAILQLDKLKITLFISIVAPAGISPLGEIPAGAINLVCHTQIINGVDRLDPTDHKYLKVKRVKFNEKNTDPETMKPV